MRHAAFVLSNNERDLLLAFIRRSRSLRKLNLRALMVLSCAERRSAEAVARQLGVSPRTVRKWRRRYVQAGVAGLRDRRRSGRPPRLAPETVEHLIREIVKRPLPERERWSVRKVADELGLSRATIGRAWMRAHIEEGWQRKGMA
jgi:transposase